MRKTKIEYGIDLGTTNSSIATIKNGKIEIIRNPMNQKEVTPSCVYFYSKKTIVGDKAKNKLEQENLNAFRTRTQIAENNGFIEFKRTMGYEKEYFCTIREKAFSSEELSAEIIKTLKNYIIDEEINTAVITVPMRFSSLQIDATQRAAELAGLVYCELLQEPIAAAMAFGIQNNNLEGYFLVFDFGGGTFDVALMHIEDRIMKVVDTAGDNHLGGKDIDYTIVNDILIPHLNKEKEIENLLNNNELELLKYTLKPNSEEIKIYLSKRNICKFDVDEPLDESEDIELRIEVNLTDFEKATKHHFQRSIDITKKLLNANKLKGTDLESILLVGGTTYSQTIRRMIKEQITDKINTSIDPLTAVSQGAALYAFTKDIPENIQDKNRDKTLIQLTLEYPETTVETDVKLGIKIDHDKMEGNVPSIFQAEIIRSDKGWSSGLFKITDSEVITILLNENETNNFIISLYDETKVPFPCEPNNLNIMQGFIPPDAILPIDLCIGISDEDNNYEKLELIKGLEKNTPIKDYVKGNTKSLYTNQDIRPGNNEDKIRIPIYEGNHSTRSIHNERRAEVIITGNDITEFLPKNSEVKISLKIDSSRRKAELTAFFPETDETVKIKEVKLTNIIPKSEELESKIVNAKAELSYFENENIRFDKNLKNNLNQIDKDLGNNKDDDTRNKVLNRMRELFMDIDRINNKHKFPKLRKEMNDLLEEIKVINERYGNDDTSRITKKIEKQADDVSKSGDILLVQDFIKEIRAFRFAILRTRIEYWMNIVKYYDNNFDDCKWKNEKAVKNLICDAKEVMTSSEPTAEKLETITFKIWDLLIDEEQPTTSDELIKELLKE
ncbi:MAG: Hsp70 family protein [Candidatus Heimdallarchaeaceae archaeon]